MISGAELYGGSTKNLRTGEIFSYTNKTKNYDLTSNKKSFVEFLLPKPLHKSIFYFADFCNFSISSNPIDDIKYEGLWINNKGLLEKDNLVSIKYSCDKLSEEDISIIIKKSKELCKILNQECFCLLINEVMVIVDK